MNFAIYIPSLGRSGRPRLTVDMLPPPARVMTYVVVPPKEAEQYKVRLHNSGAKVVPCPVKGIGATRDWIMQHAQQTGKKRLVMLDDDLDLQKRRDDGRITKCSEAEWMEALKWIDETLSAGFAHCSWGVRFLNWAEKVKEHVDCARAMYCLAYDLKKVKKEGASFTRGLSAKLVMEDFNMTLQLLKAGHPNRVSLVWRSSPGPSQINGGCSTYRTAQMQTASAKKLAQLYPDVVKLRNKKEEWNGMNKEGDMMDVTIRWQKALGVR